MLCRRLQKSVKIDALDFIKTQSELLKNLEFYPNLTQSISEVVYENLDGETVDGDLEIKLYLV